MRRGTTRHLVFALFALVAGFVTPATALAHGVAHLHLRVDHHGANRTEAHKSSAVLLGSADHGADHAALHCRKDATRSPNTVLLVSAVGAFAPTPKVRTAIIITRASDPPPSQLVPPDQPRAPPRG